MNAASARNPLPKPDMGGLNDDWKRLQELRRLEREQEEAAAREAEAAGAPASTEADTEADEPAPPPRSRPGRSRGGRRPPPEASSAVPTTIRFDPDEAGQIDRFILELRSDARRTQLDKAEVFRELIRMAQEHEPTRKALLRRLR